MEAFLQERLISFEEEGNLRELNLSQNLLDFSSNDILGLARSEKLKS